MMHDTEVLVRSRELDSFKRLADLIGEPVGFLKQWAKSNSDAFSFVESGACLLSRLEVEIGVNPALGELICFLCSNIKVGESLPSIDDLPGEVKAFRGFNNFGKSTARESVKWLEGCGFINVKKGSGMKLIRSFPSSILRKVDTALADVIEIPYTKKIELSGVRDVKHLANLADCSADVIEELANNHNALFDVLLSGASATERLNQKIVIYHPVFSNLITYLAFNFMVDEEIDQQRGFSEEVLRDRGTIREYSIFLEAHGYLSPILNDKRVVKKSLSELVFSGRSDQKSDELMEAAKLKAKETPDKRVDINLSDRYTCSVVYQQFKNIFDCEVIARDTIF